MKRPRIVIADMDDTYIMPLLQKFAEYFFDTIDLEIISNKTYYDRVFASPQTVDILIVSDRLYEESLCMQNIENIFVLNEQMKEDSQINNVTYVYKYTSVREIFSTVTGKCANILGVSSTETEKSQIILFYSGAGGVGKTTISMGISAYLAQNYKRVLYINAARLQLFQNMLSNPAPISDTNIYTKMMDVMDGVYHEIKHIIRQEGFSYIPPFKAALMALELDYTVFEKLAVEAKQSGNYDYVIIDADTVLDEYKTRLIDISDKVFIITRQDEMSVYSTSMTVKNISGINREKFILLCNDFDTEKVNALLSLGKSLNFPVSEYIEHIESDRCLSLDELVKNGDIRKVAFLIF